MGWLVDIFKPDGAKTAVSGTGNTAITEETTSLMDSARIIEGDSVELAAHSRFVGAGANTGIQLGANAMLNNGVLVGENSQFTQTSMDDNTKSMLDSALSLVGHNADNMIKLAASDAKASQIGYLPPPDASSSGQSLDMTKTGWVVVVFLLTLAGILIAIVSRKGKKKK